MRSRAQRARQRQGFFELAHDLIWICDLRGVFVQLNPSLEHALGRPARQLVGTPMVDLAHPEDRPALLAELDGLARGGLMFGFECRFQRVDGGYAWLECRGTGDPAGLVYCVARDVTEAMALRQGLQISRASNGALVQEVHHRVNNTLQLVCSLVALQQRAVTDLGGRAALRDCHARLRAVALVHEFLQRREDCCGIELGDYARELAGMLLHGAGDQVAQVRLDTSLESVSLFADQAVPCGLVLGELLGNALRHGFPPGGTGTIHLCVERLAGLTCRVSVADDGAGLPDGFAIETHAGFGLQLASTLVAQLDGTLEVSAAALTTFCFTFECAAEP